MGERVNGIHEVRGSIPLASTTGRLGGQAADGRLSPQVAQDRRTGGVVRRHSSRLDSGGARE